MPKVVTSTIFDWSTCVMEGWTYSALFINAVAHWKFWFCIDRFSFFGYYNTSTNTLTCTVTDKIIIKVSVTQLNSSLTRQAFIKSYEHFTCIPVSSLTDLPRVFGSAAMDGVDCGNGSFSAPNGMLPYAFLLHTQARRYCHRHCFNYLYNLGWELADKGKVQQPSCSSDDFLSLADNLAPSCHLYWWSLKIQQYSVS